MLGALLALALPADALRLVFAVFVGLVGLRLARDGIRGDPHVAGELTPYDPTLFEGSAAHYRFGRPPYSPQLEAVLGEELRLDGSGRLLDGGCGPGILTIRLAHLFEEAVGLDPDAAMLAEGRRVADERGIAEHPLGAGPGRGPPRGCAGAVPARHLRPVPSTGRTSTG